MSLHESLTPYGCMSMLYTLCEHPAVPSAKDIVQCCINVHALAASWASGTGPAALVVADCSCCLSMIMNAASLASPLPALLRCATFICLWVLFGFNSPDNWETGLWQVRRSSLASTVHDLVFRNQDFPVEPIVTAYELCKRNTMRLTYYFLQNLPASIRRLVYCSCTAAHVTFRRLGLPSSCCDHTLRYALVSAVPPLRY